MRGQKNLKKKNYYYFLKLDLHEMFAFVSSQFTFCAKAFFFSLKKYL